MKLTSDVSNHVVRKDDTLFCQSSSKVREKSIFISQCRDIFSLPDSNREIPSGNIPEIAGRKYYNFNK